MGLFTDLTQIFAAGYGWLLVFFIMSWQLFAPKYLNQDTVLSPIIRDVPEKVDELADSQEEIRSDVDDLSEHLDDVQNGQKTSMQVLRAQARADPQMNHERVDEYLRKNGVEPDEFLHGNEIDGYQNWRDENADREEV